MSETMLETGRRSATSLCTRPLGCGVNAEIQKSPTQAVAQNREMAAQVSVGMDRVAFEASK